MRAHFRYLSFKIFPMIQRTPQDIEVWPLQLLSEVSGVHRDFISQSGSCLGSVRVHSLTLSNTFSHSRKCDVTPGLSLALTPELALALALGLPLGLQPYNPFVFGLEPKARVATSLFHNLLQTMVFFFLLQLLIHRFFRLSHTFHGFGAGLVI